MDNLGWQLGFDTNPDCRYLTTWKDSTISCVSPVRYMLAVVRSNETVIVQLQVTNWNLDVEIVAFLLLTLKLVSLNKAEHTAMQSNCLM